MALYYKKSKEPMYVLAVETSCDETAAAVVNDTGSVLSNIVASQIKDHAAFGGVVPEIASRKHTELIGPVVKEALDEAGISGKELGAVAVTQGPGLVGALLVGISYAKALAYGLNIPLFGINHLEGHLCAAKIEHDVTTMPQERLTTRSPSSSISDTREAWSSRG
jgi:N6-L-threonylcarbamoyladenine synthase